MPRLLKYLLVVIMIVVVMVLVVDTGKESARAPVAQEAAIANSAGPQSVPAHHAQSGVASHMADCALARAYAAVGAAAAGNPRLILALDPMAKERLDDARILLQESPLFAGRSASPAEVRSAMQPVLPSNTRVVTATPERSTQVGDDINTAGVGTTSTNGPLTLDLAHTVSAAQALRDTPQGPVFQQPGLWAKASFNPALQQQLVITDACAGGYAIAIYAADYSTIRLDGGLVVPGRYYQVDGHSVITGDSGCNVDIRPLSVVPTYSRGAARLPQSNG
jgi:hypothetical protein